jgi:hypothetical protein
MLTGVETAGIVLAVLPLIISALEHYKQGLRPILLVLRWRRHLNQLNKLIRRLTAQHVHYKQDLIALLKAAVPNEKIERLLVLDDFKDLLEQEDVGLKLQLYLDFAYDAFQDTVKEYRRILEEISKNLKHLQLPSEVRSPFPNPLQDSWRLLRSQH